MKIWIHVNGTQEGPFLLEELPLGRMTKDTPVWHAGMKDWMAAKDAPATAALFAAKPEPPSPEQPAPQPTPASPEQPAQDAEPAAEDFSEDKPAGQAGYVDHSEINEPQQPRAAEPDKAEQEPQWTDDKPEPKFVRMQREQWERWQRKQMPLKYPNTYFIWSIILTMVCCNPVAVASLILGIVTKSKFNRGDYDGALSTSRINEWLVIIAIVTSLLSMPLMLLLKL